MSEKTALLSRESRYSSATGIDRAVTDRAESNWHQVEITLQNRRKIEICVLIAVVAVVLGLFSIPIILYIKNMVSRL